LQNPTVAEPLKTQQQVLEALTRDKELISGFDIAREFDLAHAAFVSTVAVQDEVHTRLNGKWLTHHLAVSHLKNAGRPNVTAEEAADEWSAHLSTSGGLPAVRDWWTRVTRTPP
jgi:hypothetical protein